MSVILGGVDLDDRLLLRGLFDSPQMNIVISRTVTGSRLVVRKPTPGRDLELTTEGPNGVKYGLFTREQLDAVATLRDAGEPVQLNHKGTLYTVLLPSDCINVTPITETSSKSAADWYAGSITMLEVA